jgi:hypothetical protein
VCHHKLIRNLLGTATHSENVMNIVHPGFQSDCLT